jgi:exopolysaccharide biosynthesis polyprenyl glycosylphosphotransferase
MFFTSPPEPDMSFTVSRFMVEVSSRAVETEVGIGSAAAEASAPGREQASWRARSLRGDRRGLLRRLLALADVFAALLAGLSLVIVTESGSAQFVWSLALLPLWIVLAKVLGLYDRDTRALRHMTVQEVPMLVLWALLGTTLLSLFLDVAPAGRPDASSAIVAGVVAALSAIVLRASARWLWRSVVPPTRVALVGTIGAAEALRRKLELFPDVHASIVAVHDPDHVEHAVDLFAGVDRVCYAPASLDDEEFARIAELARSAGASLSMIPPSPRQFAGGVRLDHLAGLPVLEYNVGDIPRSSLFLKRVLDVVVAAVALVLLLPVFAVIAVAIKLDSRGAVFFSQLRAGQNGRAFRMRKFRSMVTEAEDLLDALVPLDRLEEPMFKLRADPRVTRVGRVLRRWSLDELPQLWNVLAGQMSLVGPRPEQLEIVERYEPEHLFRLSIKPGITGPMQVYGRGELTFAERLALEAEYIDDLSLGRDLHILGMTLSTVVRGGGAY